MKNQSELYSGCAQLLKNLRLKKGYSKAQMASVIGVDAHTWAKYESGESYPSTPDFIYIFEQLGEDALRSMLDYIYPDVYKDIEKHDDPETLRDAGLHYVSHVATDQFVREWDYLIFGKHGSNIAAQMEMFTMIDHLPMIYRYAIANMVMMFWEVGQAKGELINTDRAMPDIEVFQNGLIKGKQATLEGRNAYTTIIEKK